MFSDVMIDGYMVSRGRHNRINLDFTERQLGRRTDIAFYFDYTGPVMIAFGDAEHGLA